MAPGLGRVLRRCVPHPRRLSRFPASAPALGAVHGRLHADGIQQGVIGAAWHAGNSGVRLVTREDRELLAELAQLNTDMVPLAMRVMDDSASSAEQKDY